MLGEHNALGKDIKDLAENMPDEKLSSEDEGRRKRNKTRGKFNSSNASKKYRHSLELQGPHVFFVEHAGIVAPSVRYQKTSG